MKWSKVFEVSMPCTGSRSMAVAAAMLGVNACHGSNGDKDLDEDWRVSVVRGEYPQPQCRLITEYDYVGQYPSVAWRQLAHEYPDAGFILCHRNSTQWIERMKNRRYHGEGHVSNALQNPMPLMCINRLLLFGSVAFDEIGWYHAYLRHNKEVQEELGDRQGRLLVVNLWGERRPRVNWDTLANWLDVDTATVPLNEPFPHIRSYKRALATLCNQWSMADAD